MSIIAEHKLQIRSKSIIKYTKFTGYHLRSASQEASAWRNLIEKVTADGEERKPYCGEMTAGSTKRLNKAIELMVQSTKREFVTNPYTGKRMPFQIGFTTLTIHSPGVFIPAKEAHKKLLAPFLQWLRRQHNCYLYIWKAEKQMNRLDVQQLHYHLLLGKFIPHEEVRKKWNELNAQAGYLDEYYNEHGNYDAPSTEVKAARDHEDLCGYIKKEMFFMYSKNVNGELLKTMQNVGTVGGKVWDCSMNLKEMSYFEVDADKYKGVVNNLIKQASFRVAFEDKNCAVIAANDRNPFTILDRVDEWLYKDHLDYIRNNEYRKAPPKTTVMEYEKRRYKPVQTILFGLN